MPEPLRFFSLNCESDKHWPLIFPFVKKFQPDVICLQEVLEVDLEVIQKEFGMEGIFAPTAKILQENSYDIPPRGRWGVCILTKLPFSDANYIYYKGSGDHIPELISGAPNAGNRVLVTMHVEKDGLEYRVGTTHFTWSFDGGTTEEQLRDFASLNKALDKFPEVILCGDFNAPRGREIFGALSTRYHDNIPDKYTSSLDPVMHKVGHKQLMIDGLFTAPVYTASEVEVVCGLSDHCGVKALIQKEE
jgi:endonuclease/exonuclease/phosphatase family metal-dependent hydrolase